jgi:hypothetical protein
MIPVSVNTRLHCEHAVTVMIPVSGGCGPQVMAVSRGRAIPPDGGGGNRPPAYGRNWGLEPPFGAHTDALLSKVGVHDPRFPRGFYGFVPPRVSATSTRRGLHTPKTLKKGDAAPLDATSPSIS